MSNPTPKPTAEEAIREAISTATAAWTERWKSERAERPEATPHFEDDLVQCVLPLLDAATRKAFDQAAEVVMKLAEPHDITWSTADDIASAIRALAKD